MRKSILNLLCAHMVTFHVSALELSKLLVNSDCTNCTVSSTSSLIVDEPESIPKLVEKQNMLKSEIRKYNENQTAMTQQKNTKKCTDSNYLYQNVEGQTCKWISLRNHKDVLCAKKLVGKKCRQSCGKDAQFPHQGECKKCGFISSKNWKEVCKSEYILENCLECCKFGGPEQALVELYESTGGTKWTKSDNWGSSAGPCTWHGISCKASLISEIDLSENNLIGTIPPALFCLTELESLRMSDNFLKGRIPSNIGNLVKLTEVALGVNELTGQVPPSLTDLEKLTDIKLAHNSLTGQIPVNIRRQLSLQHIDISDSQLDGLIPSELGKLTNLRHLSFANNMLSGTVPLELGEIRKLTILKIGNNALSGDVPEALFALEDLNVLDLSSNKLKGHLPKALDRKTGPNGEGGIIVQNKLEYIQLYENQMTGNIPTEMGNLDELRTLSLSSNQLEGSIPTELGKLNKIIELFLNDNSLTGEVPSEVCELKIEFLNVDDVEVTACPPDKCEDDLIKEFTISGEKMYCKDIIDEDVRAKLCHIRVVHSTCPKMCGTCCTSDKKYTFLDHYKEPQYCDFIDSVGKQEAFCEIGTRTYEFCGLECGCTNYSEMTPHPSMMATTTKPSPNPSTSPSLAIMKEYDVLMELYYATKGPTWDKSLYWNEKDNHCEWLWVECDNEKVIMLNLDENNLSGSIPPNLWMLTELRELKLAGNFITGTIPSQIGMMNSLEWMDVSDNDIKGTIPTEVGMMNSLEQWASYENKKMWGTVPDEICGLPSLKRFYFEKGVNAKLECDEF